MNKDDILYLADKLLIDLTDEEVEKLENEFSYIEKNMDLINNIEGINEVNPMHMVPFNDLVYLREDTYEKSLSKEEIIKNCKDVLDEQVRVPKVVEE